MHNSLLLLCYYPPYGLICQNSRHQTLLESRYRSKRLRTPLARILLFTESYKLGIYPRSQTQNSCSSLHRRAPRIPPTYARPTPAQLTMNSSSAPSKESSYDLVLLHYNGNYAPAFNMEEGIHRQIVISLREKWPGHFGNVDGRHIRIGRVLDEDEPGRIRFRLRYPEDWNALRDAYLTELGDQLSLHDYIWTSHTDDGAAIYARGFMVRIHGNEASYAATAIVNRIPAQHYSTGGPGGKPVRYGPGNTRIVRVVRLDGFPPTDLYSVIAGVFRDESDHEIRLQHENSWSMDVTCVKVERTKARWGRKRLKGKEKPGSRA